MLELRRLHAAYGAATALRDISLRVDAGELVCVVGPNGAGKTTLINVIAGLHSPISGTMTFGGRELARLPAHRFCAEGIVIVPEARRLFGGMTVRENLELGSYIAAARAHRAASLQRVCAMFPALTAKLDQPAGALSGGQQQMVAIARALMARPKLLLLDEPSSGLNVEETEDMAWWIQDIQHELGITVLMVEHDMSLVSKVSDRVLAMNQGETLALGSPREVQSDPRVIEAYLGSAEDMSFLRRPVPFVRTGS